MKTIFEWMQIRDLKSSNSDVACGLKTIYDETMVQAQVESWLDKLIGLTSDVPTKQKKAMAENIIKDIRKRMIKG